MALLKKWRDMAYSETANKGDLQRLWTKYFEQERDIYALLLENPAEEVKGTVKELAEKYATGAVVLSRLCPVDYHRFHFPAAGVPEAPVRIPGPLASVSPYCLRHNLSWLWTNKRELTILHTEELGDVLCLAVGATGVGAIFQTYTPGQAVDKGSEHGYFAFGGSTVMTFFEPGRIQLAPDLLENTANGFETFARMGDILGTIC